MKNQMLILCILATNFGLNAADTTRLKPVKGTITSQVGIALSTFSNNVMSMGINGRLFLSERVAIRTSILSSNDKEVENFEEFQDGSGSRGKYTTVMSSAFLFAGIEKHFKGARRLSPYIGFEFGYGIGTLKEDGENSSGFNYTAGYSESSKRKVNQFNINAFLGFDYWIAEGLYLGIEYSFISNYNYKEKRTSKTITNSGFTTVVYTPEYKASGITSINALPVFRLGWMF